MEVHVVLLNANFGYSRVQAIEAEEHTKTVMRMACVSIILSVHWRQF